LIRRTHLLFHREKQRMRIALHSVSYGGVWPGQVTLPIERVIQKAREFGCDGIMLMAKRPHGSVLDLNSSRLEQLRAELDRAGVAVACIAGYTDAGAGWDFPDNPYSEKEVFYITRLAEIAAALGSKVVRVFTAFERPGDAIPRIHDRVVKVLREAADRAAGLGITIGVQNHHDHAAHYLAIQDLLGEIDRPNCRACFDAWAVAIHGDDLGEAARTMAPLTAFTTVADYQVRKRFKYHPPLVSYSAEQPYFQMVPLGQGFIDYHAFLGGLRAGGYDGWVGFEMCAPFVRGGSEEVLDDVAQVSIAYLKKLLKL
jgi:sugar phosphate isomerase/epimerase